MRTARAFLAEAILAAAIAGIIEGLRLTALGARFSIATLGQIAALACAGALVAALAVRAIVAVLGRIPAVSRWRGELAADATRPLAVARVATVFAGATAIALPAYLGGRAAHDTFRFADSNYVGLAVAAAVVALVALVVPLVLAAHRRLARRLATSDRAVTLLAGRRRWVLAGGCALLAWRLPVALMGIAAPAVDAAPLSGALLLAVVVIVLRAIRAGMRRSSQIAAAVAIVAAVTGSLQIGRAERARVLLVTYGVFGKLATKMIWRLADADRDGYAAPSMGGADCDDSDPRRHPSATDTAGNGIDENCTGRDATREELAARERPRPMTPTTTPPPKYNVVLISIDALRADHLGTYGNPRAVSPAIDAFAATATRFLWAFTACPATRCAIPAMMTGRLPTAADVEAPTLAGTLRAAGWDTVSITCCERFSIKSHDADGFTTVDISADSTRVRRAGQSNADVLADGALRWLGQRPKSAPPFFLWMHFYDPHHPYAPPVGADRFGSGSLDHYDAEVAFVDEHVGRVIAALDPATTIIALTADHGEEFGEHGIRFHAGSVFNQVTHVPLLVRYPAAPPHAVMAPVSLVDVMPTLLELVGLPPPGGINGYSLAPAIRDAASAPPKRSVMIELTPDNVIRRDAIALVENGWKVIWNREANAWSLYELATDPDDADDRADAEPARLEELHKRLFDAMDRELGMR